MGETELEGPKGRAQNKAATGDKRGERRGGRTCDGQ
jgi:hypothetical protein